MTPEKGSFNPPKGMATHRLRTAESEAPEREASWSTVIGMCQYRFKSTSHDKALLRGTQATA